jgi:hypothetical protein
VATAVLIIACPCALTLAAPMALGTAMTALGQRGIYVRDTGVVMTLSRINVVAFDKTGTLTSKVDARDAARAIGPEAWRWCGGWPVSRSIRSVAPSLLKRRCRRRRGLGGVGPGSEAGLGVSAVEEIAGGGLKGRVDDMWSSSAPPSSSRRYPWACRLTSIFRSGRRH